MPSITQQKHDLREILHRIVMEEYDKSDPNARRSLMVGLLAQHSGHLTLSELRAWHNGIVIRKGMQEKIALAREMLASARAKGD